MAKQLNVNLAFNADTTQAKAQIQQLQSQLQKLASSTATSTKGLGLNKEINDAISKVVQLQSALQNAQSSTGGLDLGKFNQSLVKSKTSITDYADALATLGPEGKQAFATLAQSITTAEVPLKRANGVLTEFATTMKNTVRWQISSSVLHGFMGSLNGAYRYAQDLNESLNSIRIVTGQTTEQMAAFAEQANRAAKELSTTTVAYTDAALIFYQQGLDDNAVIERTNAVIKMANVTKESETEVSSYMTAIWNNFAGEKERLEEYADVITALGAATASSSAEIAGGLEKFAAIGQQIGLSYDYATTALATVVARTRQSEDVVGTAFKTIFARIQGLNLGETLDDGTDLNKYSQALAAVGISIKDASGELKDMDTILDEMGTRWQTLAKDEQVALAQTVAGVRQYNQLIALMDSWQTDFQNNLGVAKNSSGELEKQAQIYAESWEAARDRVKASAQAIYADLLDDDAFISIANGFAKFLDVIENTIDGLGGLVGVLPLVASLLFRAFGKDIVASIERMAYNIQITSEKGRQAVRNLRTETNQAMADMFNDESISGSAMAAVFKETAQLQEQILAKTDQLKVHNRELTQEEQQQIQQILSINKALGDQYINVAKLREEEERRTAQLEAQAQQRISSASSRGGSYSGADFKKQIADVKEMQKQYSLVYSALQKIQSATKKVNSSNFKNVQKDIDQFLKAAEKAGITIDSKLRSALERVGKATSLDNMKTEINGLETAVEKFGVKAYDAFEDIRQAAQDGGANMKQLNPILDQLQASMSRTGELTEEQIALLKSFGVEVDNAGKVISKMNGPANGAAQGFVALGNVMSTTAMAFSSFKGLFDTWNNEDMSMGEKLLTTFTTLGMVIPMVTTLFKKQTVEQLAGLSASILQAVGLGGLSTAELLTTVATEGLTAATASFGVTLYTVLWPIGLVILAVGALVAAIAGLVMLIKDAEARSPEGQLKKSQAAADSLAAALGDAKQEASALESSFNSYNSVVDKLNQCVKGTEEWTEALKEVNNEVLSILEEYPELMEMKDAITRDENGMLVISDEAMEQMQKLADNKVDVLQSANLMAQQTVRQDKLKVEIDDSSINKLFKTGQYTTTTNPNGTSTTTPEYFNPKAIIADNLDEINGLVGEELREKLVEILEKPAQSAGMTTTYFDSMIDSLMGCSTEIQTLATAAEVTATALEQTANTIAAETLGDEYDGAETEMASEVYERAYEESYDRWMSIGAHNGTKTYTMADGTKKSFEGVSKTSEYKSNKSVQAIWDAYNEAMGTNYKMDKNNGVLGTDGAREFQYIDDGDKKKVTLEEVASTIAAAEALEAMGKAADEARETLENMEDKIADADIANGIRNFIASKDFESMSQEDFAKLKADVESTNINGVTGTEAYLDKIFGDGQDGKIDVTTANKYGYETVAEMVQAFEEGMADYDTAFDDLSNHWLDAVGEAFDKLDTSKLSISQAKIIGDTMEQAMENSDSVEAFTNLYNAIPIEKTDEFAGVLENIDWQTITVDELSNNLKAAGIETIGFDTELQYLIETMKVDTVQSMDAIGAKFKSINDIAKDLKLGDIISAEDFEVLGDGFEGYFTRMADGTYKLTGDAEKFYELVHKQMVSDYQSNISQIEGEIGTLKQLQKLDYDTLSKNTMTKNAEGSTYAYSYSGTHVNSQVDTLEMLGYDPKKIEDWRKELEGNDVSDVAMLDDITEAIQQYESSFENLDTKIESLNGAIYEQELAIATSYESFEDLNEAFERGEFSAQALNQAMVILDNQLDTADLDTEEWNDYAEHIQDCADSSEYFADSLKDDKDAAKIVAKSIMKMNDGIETLADGYEDWADVLKKSSKESEEYAEAVNGMRDALGDVLDVSKDFISGQFVADNLDLIKQAAEGDAEAIDKLKSLLADDIIANIIVNNDLESAKEDILADYQSLKSMIDEMDLQVGASIDIDNLNADEQSFIDACNEIIKNAHMTAEQANAFFDSMGFETNFVTKEQPTAQRVPEYVTETIDEGTETITNPDGTQHTMVRTRTRTYQDGYYEAEGKMDAIAMAVSEDGTEVPQIQSITQKATGSANNYSSSNSGGPKSNGSKPKEAKKLEKKTNEDPELDRYHVITEQLERLNAELDKISKAKDRAFGAKRLKLMDQEIAKTNEIIKKNEEYAALLKRNRDDEKSKLAALGAQFDDKGVITNYNELIKNNQADYSEYNKGIDYYNSLSGDAQEALDKQYQAMKDSYGNYYSGYQDYLETLYAKTAEERQEEFEKLLEDYESDQEQYEAILQEIQDAKDSIFDMELEKIDYVVEIKLDVDDSDIKYLEFLLTELEDKDFHAAEAIANIGLQTGKSLDKIKQYEKGIEDILKLSGYEGGIEGLKSGDISLEELQEGGLTEEGLAKLQEYIDGLAEENEALRAMRENAWAQVSDEFDEYIEKMDDGIEKIEHLKSITQSYQNIVDIVGKKYLGVSNDLVDKMNKSMVSQSQDLLKANKAKLEATQASYDQLMNEDTSGWSDQALKERQQLLDKMKDELQNAKEAFMSSWEEALQASADRYAAAVDNIIEEFSDKIAGLYGSLSELQEAYDKASDLDSQYLEDYEQIYQLSKLTRDINNSIDDTDNIAAKEEYKALLEEINQIEADGTKLSEYDLEVLQKKFELKQAQIALEEAQNAKSSVGMVRGEDGNYSYVYTANDDDVANAEQNYEDKLHEMQVLNGDYINNLQEQIIQTQQECADALAAIKESDFNSYEEWREAVDRTQAYYDQKMDFYYSQLDGALGNNRELYENDWARYSELTGYKISSDENYVDKFEETNYSILTGYTTLEEAHSAWTVATGEMLTDLATAYNEWQIDVETAMGLAGTSVDGFAEQMEQDTDRNVQDSQEAAEAVVDMGQQMEETFSETLSAIANWEAEWGSAIDDAIAKNLELIQSFNDMKREMADAMNAVSSYNPGGDSGSGSGSGGGGSNSGGDSGGSGSGGGANNADKVEGVAAAIWMDGGSTSGWYNGSDRQSRLKEKGVTGAQAYINAHGPNGDIYAAWNKKRNQLKSFYYGSFDTGGYTGDWGDKSGRLALLHSKEIVLNAKDTENFLQAIDMVREISGRIDLNAKYATAMMDMMQPTIGRGGAPEIVQNIEINADFPDATDHSEIEMAFNNLINTASQYANRVR